MNVFNVYMLAHFDSKLFLDEFLVPVGTTTSCMKAPRRGQVRLNKVLLFYELYELGNILLREVEKLEFPSEMPSYNKMKHLTI